MTDLFSDFAAWEQEHAPLLAVLEQQQTILAYRLAPVRRFLKLLSRLHSLRPQFLAETPQLEEMGTFAFYYLEEQMTDIAYYREKLGDAFWEFAPTLNYSLYLGDLLLNIEMGLISAAQEAAEAAERLEALRTEVDRFVDRGQAATAADFQRFERIANGIFATISEESAKVTYPEYCEELGTDLESLVDDYEIEAMLKREAERHKKKES